MTKTHLSIFGLLALGNFLSAMVAVAIFHFNGVNNVLVLFTLIPMALGFINFAVTVLIAKQIEKIELENLDEPKPKTLANYLRDLHGLN